MKALFEVELWRLSSRRAIRVLFVVAVTGIVVGGTILFFRSRIPGEPPFKWTEVKEVMLGLSPLLMVMGWAIGATAIGAEWGSKVMTTTLTWEPRRVRLFVMKVLATAVIVFTLAVAIQLLLVGSTYPAAALNGSLEGVDGSWAAELAGAVLRVGLAASLTSMIAFAIAAVGRNSAAALGIGFVYLAVIEGLIRGVKSEWAPWLIGENTATLIIGAGSDSPLVDRSVVVAALVVIAYAAVLLATAGLSYRRRDVT